MKRRFDFDGALKEMFERDRPILIEKLTGGIAVKAFLNVELPKVQSRRVDLLLLLVDGSILHIELQSKNHKWMAHRVAMYHLLLVQQYKTRIRHVVVYVGQPRMNMPVRLDTGPLQFTYEAMDIRVLSVDELLNTGRSADCALAVLAGDGPGRLRDIVQKIAELPDNGERDHVIAQLMILSGLRGLERAVKDEYSLMSVIDITKNTVIMEMMHETEAKWRETGREEGREEGALFGVQKTLRTLLKSKFGRVPVWVQQRLASATADELDHWCQKILVADTIEGVVGKRS